MSDRKTALVTGGAGFIGSALVRRLAQDPYYGRIVVVDALTYAGRRDNLDGLVLQGGTPIELTITDICDEPAIAAIVDRVRPDVVFHLAAESHVDRSIDDAGPFFRTNVGGTLSVFEALRRARPLLGKDVRVVHVSTDEVLGEPAHGVWLDETAGCAPRSPYAASKAAGEHVARAWAITHGMHVVVVRPANVFGPRQLPEKLIPLVTLRGSAGRSLPVYGDGSARRDWIHVDDACDGLVLAALTPSGTVVHLASGAERSTVEVVEAICAALDVRHPRAVGTHRDLVELVADRPGHDRRYGIDGAATRRLLGWQPRVAFDAGIDATVGWYLDNEAWWRDLGPIGERLGLSTTSDTTPGPSPRAAT